MNFYRQGSDWRRPQDPLSKLLALLDTQLALEHLDIRADGLLHEHVTESNHVVRLPSLKKLNIRYQRFLHKYPSRASSLALPSMLMALELPNVQKMVLQVPVTDGDFALETLFPYFNIYAKLEDLSLQLYRYRNYWSRSFKLTLSPFKTIFRRSRYMRRFATESSATGMTGETPEYLSARPPPLLELDLSKCEDVSDDDVKSVLQYLNQGQDWGEFQELRLHMSRVDDTTGTEFLPTLQSIIPPHKVHFDSES